jgi:hypothetical protein
MRVFTAPDGVRWGVEVALPGTSTAMIIFHHPDDATARRDRYNWVISQGPEARNVTSRLTPDRVMEQLTDDAIGRLFRRSMPISRADSRTPPTAAA